MHSGRGDSGGMAAAPAQATPAEVEGLVGSEAGLIERMPDEDLRIESTALDAVISEVGGSADLERAVAKASTPCSTRSSVDCRSSTSPLARSASRPPRATFDSPWLLWGWWPPGARTGWWRRLQREVTSPPSLTSRRTWAVRSSPLWTRTRRRTSISPSMRRKASRFGRQLTAASTLWTMPGLPRVASPRRGRSTRRA